MLRNVVGIVLGYVVMAAVVFIGLTAAWFAMRADGAFRPGVYDVSPLWIAVSLVVSVVAALLGGVVVRRVSHSVGATYVLAGLVIVLGIVAALPVLTGDATEVATRTGVPSMTEAMRQARTPLWVALLNPVIGAIGVLLGGGAFRGEQAAAPERRVAA